MRTLWPGGCHSTVHIHTSHRLVVLLLGTRQSNNGGDWFKRSNSNLKWLRQIWNDLFWFTIWLRPSVERDTYRMTCHMRQCNAWENEARFCPKKTLGILGDDKAPCLTWPSKSCYQKYFIRTHWRHSVSKIRHFCALYVTR